MEGLLLTADLRWFDYRTTKLLGEPVVDGGANWDSIWAVALGGRYQVNDRLSVQAGYLFNENPVPARLSVFNIQLPLINMHTLTLGTYFQMNDSIGFSLAYAHGFHTSITGSLIQDPTVASTTLKSEYDAFFFNLHITFGPSCKSCPAGSACGASASTRGEAALKQ